MQADDVIRVAIVDDHPIARYGVEHVIDARPGIEVACSAASLAELTEALPGDEPVDVVILDLYLDSDEPALTAISGLASTTRVLVMSASGRPSDVLAAVRAGASGYLTKRSGADVIVATVEAVAAGNFVLSGELADVIQAELLAHPVQPEARPGMASDHRGTPRLSPREEEALSWVAKGFTHSQIATRMGVGKATVDTYIERIRAKLQVGNKAELTRAALKRLSHPDDPS